MSSVQAIERAFAVLGALADGPLGVTEVADRSGLPKSTAARMLTTLAHEGAVEQVPGDTRYRLGPRMATLAAGLTPARSLAALARPRSPSSRRAAGEAAGLAVPDGDLVHYIDQVDTPNPVRSATGPARGSPLHAVSSGQVLLAFRPPARSSATSSGRSSGSRRARSTDPDALRERLREIRRDGFAWVHEEFDEGIYSVAAPIADALGEVVAAVHVHGPSYRFPADGQDPAIAGAVVAPRPGIAAEPAR